MVPYLSDWLFGYELSDYKVSKDETVSYIKYLR